MNEETDKNKEVLERGKVFLEKYKALVEETKIDFATYPVFRPNSSGAFEVVIQSTPVDITNQGKPSPFVKEE